MTYEGVAKGKVIELDEPLPYPEGQPVRVAVEPLIAQPHPGSAAAILQAMHEAPHLTEEDVAELERAIDEGKLPVSQGGVFDGTP
jgi:hypothetical protein